MKINFEFLSGVSARDYTDVAKKANLKPIELNMQKLEDMMSYLIHQMSSIMTKEKKGQVLGDAVSSKIVTFSICTLIVIAVISFSEVVYLKRYWMNRKLI